MVKFVILKKSSKRIINYNKLRIMFGDMQGMMAKLKEAQAKIEETKNRLNS